MTSPLWQSPRHVVLCIGVLLCFGQPLSAQPTRLDPTDVQSWYTVGLDLDLPNKFGAAFDYRHRMQNNAATYRGSYVSGELTYALHKRFTVLGNYRWATVEGERTNRFGVGAESKLSAAGLTWSLRAIGQHRLKGSDDEESGQTLLRTRLRVKRALASRVDLYASSEPYFAFGEEYPIDNWRNTLGLRFGYGGGRTADLYYIYRPDYAKSYNRTFHVVGVTLGFDTKIGAKKAKAPKG